MLAVARQRQIGVGVGLSLRFHRVLIEGGLLVIAAPAGHHVDVGLPALGGKVVHPPVQRLHRVLPQADIDPPGQIVFALTLVDADRPRLFRIVSVVPVHQHQRPPGQIRLCGLPPFPAVRQRPRLGGGLGGGVWPGRVPLSAAGYEEDDKKHKAQQERGQEEPLSPDLPPPAGPPPLSLRLSHTLSSFCRRLADAGKNIPYPSKKSNSGGNFGRTCPPPLRPAPALCYTHRRIQPGGEPSRTTNLPPTPFWWWS